MLAVVLAMMMGIVAAVSSTTAVIQEETTEAVEEVESRKCMLPSPTEGRWSLGSSSCEDWPTPQKGTLQSLHRYTWSSLCPLCNPLPTCTYLPVSGNVNSNTQLTGSGSIEGADDDKLWAPRCTMLSVAVGHVSLKPNAEMIL